MAEEVRAERAERGERAARRRWLVWAIPAVCVVVVTAVVLAIVLPGQGSAAEQASTTVTRDAQAAMVTMTESVALTGTIAPAQRADLSFSSSGTVTAVNVAVGDQVVAGQALAAIDTTNLAASVEAAQSAVDAAQSDYDTAVASGTSARVTAANSTLATKQNALANAQSALAAGTLTAPFDGTVAIVSMAVGDTVGSGGTSGGGAGGSQASTSASITVMTTDRYSVTTSVGTSDVTRIAKGQTAQVTPNGSTAALQGTVTSVGVIASSSSASGASFPVTIDIADPQPGLYAGVSASISVITSSRQVLAVPTAAITVSQGQSSVELRVGDATVTTPVTTGASSNSMTEITSGINEGDTVVVTSLTGGNANRDPSVFSSLLPGGGNRPGGFPSGGAGGGQFGGGQNPGGGATRGR